MKRDIDLIRKIAFAIEAIKPSEILEQMDGIEEDIFCAHLQLMIDAGLIGGKASHNADGSMYGWANRLTWAGHDFLDAARSDTLWNKAKQSIIAPGSSWTFGLLTDWLKAEIQSGLPTLRRLAS